MGTPDNIDGSFCLLPNCHLSPDATGFLNYLRIDLQWQKICDHNGSSGFY